MAVVTGDEFDAILDKIETSLQSVDAAAGSMVKRTKAQLDLLGQLEVVRDSASTIVKSGDRTLLRDIFGNDCSRIARLRAALDSVSLSDMNDADQRLPTCKKVCACVEEMLKEDFGWTPRTYTAKLAEVEASCQTELVQRRVAALMAGENGKESEESGSDDDSEEENEDNAPAFDCKPMERVEEKPVNGSGVAESKAKEEEKEDKKGESNAAVSEPEGEPEAVADEAKELFKSGDKDGIEPEGATLILMAVHMTVKEMVSFGSVPIRKAPLILKNSARWFADQVRSIRSSRKKTEKLGEE